MKFSLAVLALPIAVQAAQFSKSEYASGAIHQKLMKLKAVRHILLFCLQDPVLTTSRTNGIMTQPKASKTLVNGSLGRAGRRVLGEVARINASSARMVSPSSSKAMRTRRSGVTTWISTTSSTMPTWAALKAREALLGAGQLATDASSVSSANFQVLRSSRSLRTARSSTWVVFLRKA